MDATYLATVKLSVLLLHSRPMSSYMTCRTFALCDVRDLDVWPFDFESSYHVPTFLQLCVNVWLWFLILVARAFIHRGPPGTEPDNNLDWVGRLGLKYFRNSCFSNFHYLGSLVAWSTFVPQLDLDYFSFKLHFFNWRSQLYHFRIWTFLWLLSHSFCSSLLWSSPADNGKHRTTAIL